SEIVWLAPRHDANGLSLPACPFDCDLVLATDNVEAGGNKILGNKEPTALAGLGLQVRNVRQRLLCNFRGSELLLLGRESSLLWHFASWIDRRTRFRSTA